MKNYNINPELEISNKTKELLTLENRIQRYSHRLIYEGLEAAKEHHGLRLNLYEVSDGFLDTTPIIDLAKERCPLLYNKYNHNKEKYFDVALDLNVLLKKHHWC